MRAARFYAKADIRIEDVPEPTLSPGNVLVAVEWCGVCGSDLHEYLAGPTRAFPKPGELHPLTGQNIPTTMGHEVCGRIKAVSAGSNFREGQAVMVDPRLCCRDCVSCWGGIDHCCEKLGFLGFSGISGGFSSTMLVGENMVHLIPDNVPLDCAAFIEPLVVVHHAIKAAGVEEWASLDVLVVGGGPVGIAMAMALRAHGAKQIIISEPTAARRKQLSNLADVIINPLETDVPEQCRSVTKGRGAQVVFDCAGTPNGIQAAFESICVKGVYVNIAIWEKPMIIPFAQFMLKDVTIKGSVVYDDEDFAEVMHMVGEGRFKGLENMVTARIGLEDLLEKGIKELINNKDEHIKILVTPSAENLRVKHPKLTKSVRL